MLFNNNMYYLINIISQSTLIIGWATRTIIAAGTACTNHTIQWRCTRSDGIRSGHLYIIIIMISCFGYYPVIIPTIDPCVLTTDYAVV